MRRTSVLDIDTKGAVRIVTLSRPPQNAIDGDLLTALHEALDQADAARSTAILLRSGSAHFCGGADPVRIASWIDERTGERAIEQDTRDWAALFKRIESFPAVVVAEIRGNALGAGLGLALACDLRIASVNARLGVPEARVGLLPAGLTVRRLASICGLATAQRLLLSGDILNGSEAQALALVHWVTGDDSLPTRAEEIAARIGKQSRAALIEAKLLLRSGTESYGAALDREVLALTRLVGSDDSRSRLHGLLQHLAGQAQRQ